MQEQRIDVKLSKDTQLCLALLEAPDMASEIAELCRSSRQYRQAGQFAGWILEHAIKDRRSLVRELATDNRAREQFYSLFDGIEHIPAREQTLLAPGKCLTRTGKWRASSGWRLCYRKSVAWQTLALKSGRS